MGVQETVRRDRLLLYAALGITAVIAWAYLLHQARSMEGSTGMDMGAMQHMENMAMPAMQGWTGIDVLLLFAMWAVMMVAMMAPAAAPMVLLVAHVSRQRESEAPVPRALLFAAAYFLVWTAFSIVAALVQWRLHQALLLSGRMQTTPLVGGILLTLAGVFQWTPLKRKCLVHCRSPLAFLMRFWREGSAGAFAMGVRHGAYCVGCCWLLMAVLFAVGVMNLIWVAALAAFIIVERLVIKGDVVGRVAGLALVISGVLLIVR